MQDNIDPCHGLATCCQIANIGLQESESAPCRLSYQCLHFIEIALVAGREVIKADDVLPTGQQRLNKV